MSRPAARFIAMVQIMVQIRGRPDWPAPIVQAAKTEQAL